jgi:prophage regulatory protein
MSTLQREILRLAEVKRRTGLPTSTIYKKIGDREFPRQVPIGFRTVGWLSTRSMAGLPSRSLNAIRQRHNHGPKQKPDWCRCRTQLGEFYSSAPVTSGDEAAEAEVALSLITNGVES